MREEQPMQVELYIDIKTARTLGIRLTEIASRMARSVAVLT